MAAARETSPRAPDAPSDANLLARAAGGDHDAFGILVRRYLRPATLLAAQLTGDRDEAEDVVQDAFLIVLDRAHAFDPARPFGAWLYGIVRRLSQHRHARSRRRRGLLARWRSRSDARRATPSTEAAVEAGDVLDRVRRYFVRLPEMQRQCLELHVERDLEIHEIALMHDLSESTVRQHIFRARRALRVMLEHDG